MKLRDVPAQVLGKVYAPSCLNDPDDVSRFEVVGLHDAQPLPGEVLGGKHPIRLVVGANHTVTAAGELLEVGGGRIKGNGALLAEIVTKNQVGLVVGNDEVGGVDVFSDKLQGIGHVSPALIGAVHPGLPRLAKSNASHNDQSCDGESATPSARRQTRDCQTDARDSGDNQDCDVPCAAVGIHMTEAGATGNRKGEQQEQTQLARKRSMV